MSDCFLSFCASLLRMIDKGRVKRMEMESCLLYSMDLKSKKINLTKGSSKNES